MKGMHTWTGLGFSWLTPIMMHSHDDLHAASLAEENVLVATFDIAKAFDDLQLAHKKEVYCTIVTAKVSCCRVKKNNLLMIITDLC